MSSLDNYIITLGPNEISLIDVNEIELWDGELPENWEANKQGSIAGGNDARKKVGGRDNAKSISGSGGIK